jgi:hypothetical protein
MAADLPPPSAPYRRFAQTHTHFCRHSAARRARRARPTCASRLPPATKLQFGGGASTPSIPSRSQSCSNYGLLATRSIFCRKARLGGCLWRRQFSAAWSENIVDRPIIFSFSTFKRPVAESAPCHRRREVASKMLGAVLYLNGNKYLGYMRKSNGARAGKNARPILFARSA